MNVSLTPQLEEFVQQKVASGDYGDASEVVREALSLLLEREQRREAKLASLRQAIQEGIDSGIAGPLDMEAIIRQARSELEAEQTPQGS